MKYEFYDYIWKIVIRTVIISKMLHERVNTPKYRVAVLLTILSCPLIKKITTTERDQCVSKHKAIYYEKIAKCSNGWDNIVKKCKNNIDQYESNIFCIYTFLNAFALRDSLSQRNKYSIKSASCIFA